jgi:hypothetical protein
MKGGKRGRPAILMRLRLLLTLALAGDSAAFCPHRTFGPRTSSLSVVHAGAELLSGASSKCMGRRGCTYAGVGSKTRTRGDGSRARLAWQGQLGKDSTARDVLDFFNVDLTGRSSGDFRENPLNAAPAGSQQFRALRTCS